MIDECTKLDDWKRVFFETVQSKGYAGQLRDSSLESRLGDWTRVLTEVAVATCQGLGLKASAKGHSLKRMPGADSEYLGIDVMGFEPTDQRWLFPVTAIELENSQQDERVEYSLWKVLNLRANLRIVYCYRPSFKQGPALVKTLTHQVIQAMPIADRINLDGTTAVAVGYRNSADTFPFGFFKWWELNTNTGEFEQH